jgi:hypothetical protein
MPGRCASCHRWDQTTAARARQMGPCRLDGRVVHAGYGCTSYHPSVVAVQASVGITLADLVRLRRDHGVEAEQLRNVWILLWKQPDDDPTRRRFESLLRDYRNIPPS